MLPLPTFVASAVSGKCVGSLLVRVRVGLGGVNGVAVSKLMLPWTIRLLPIIGLLRLIPGTGPTLIGAVIVVIPRDDTLRFAEPCATPVTAMVTLSCPCRTVAVAGTVATLIVSEEGLNVIPPAGAAAEMVRVTFIVLVALTLMEAG